MEFLHFVVVVFYLTGCGGIIYACHYPETFYPYFFGLLSKFYNTYINQHALSYGITLFTNYCAIKNKIDKYNKIIYYSHPYITYTIDICEYSYQFLYAEYYGHNILPFHKLWVSHNHLYVCEFTNPSYKWKNIEDYQFINYNDSQTVTYTSFIKSFNLASYLLSTTEFNPLYNDNLLFGKYFDTYVLRVQYTNMIQLKNKDEFCQPSSVSFLSIVLKFPYAKINMELDKSFLFINNELFSKTFLKRYLHYNNIDVPFTNDYTVNIMDSNINIITIKPDEYMQLNKLDYSIVKNNNQLIPTN